MTNQQEIRKRVNQAISIIKSYKEIYELFRVLEYPEDVIFKSPTKRKVDEFDFSKDIREHVKEIYTVLSFGTDLPVFLIESDLDSIPFTRDITKKLSERYLRFLLILTIDYSNIYFVYPEAEKIEVGKHRLKITRLPIETGADNQYWSDIETISYLRYTGREKSFRDVWINWRNAFDVQKVTNQFFGDFQAVFFELRTNIENQNIAVKEAHEFALQFMNRLMFIFFISKKGWLNNNPRFLKFYWEEYRKLLIKKTANHDTFYSEWLNSLFFKAFNGQSHLIDNLPNDVKNILFAFPYLNGGLFLPNATDELGISISDGQFETVLKFFSKYHFTIKEDMPIDSEVAVDPQMIGYVYESLANVAETIYDRKDMGIFYTPRVEVEFMCRRSLVEYLSNNLPEVSKEEIYRFVFDEKDSAANYFQKHNLWNELEDVLDELSVIDPACGSGAFLVGMLNVLVELYIEIYKHSDKPYAIREREFDFELKKRIIFRSLYGVDVMPWAVQAAELRLWLQMIIHSDFPEKDLMDNNPLLPNLNLNIRKGDSLVQKIGGKELYLRGLKFSESIHRKVESLKHEKQNYFRGQPGKYKTIDEFKAVESDIFVDIMEEQRNKLRKKINSKNNYFKQLSNEQTDLLDTNRNGSFKKEIHKIESEIKEIEFSLKELSNVINNIDKTGRREFIWEIDFAEIFGDKGGFDIVIGNPPYIRQENISPPNKLKKEITPKIRQAYKIELTDSVLKHFPEVNRFPKTCDYYIYFFFHGLALINKKGCMCFITSNSWLDVDYGKVLQEFLLKYVRIIGIYDCKKRSFEHADINTVISVFSSPLVNRLDTIWTNPLKKTSDWPAMKHSAKFVMFNEPFEKAINSKLNIEIENMVGEATDVEIREVTGNLISGGHYRVFRILQNDLLAYGWDYGVSTYKYESPFMEGQYVGSKWGAIFLRAPNIFFQILKKGAGLFIPLKNIARITRGKTTGCNAFFYLDKDTISTWNLEEFYLKSLLKSPRECDSIFINTDKLPNNILLCNKPKSQLKGQNVLKYINWGEKQKTKENIKYCDVPTLSNRKRWYDLGDIETARYNFNYMANEYATTYIGDVYVSDNFHRIFTDKAIGIFMNSTLSWLFQNIIGRVNFGDGLLKIQVYELESLPVLLLDVNNEEKTLSYSPKSIYEEIGFNPDMPIRSQTPKPLPTRKQIDDIVFGALGLNEEEVSEIYWSVCELVKTRLDKAKSLKK